VRPTLFTLPIGANGLPLHSYGLAIALGFAAGVVLAARQARRVGLDRDAMLDLLFWILVAGVLGSRLAFVLLHLPDYARLCSSRGDCLAALRLWDGGLVFYGGVLAATGAVALFARRRRWSLGTVADVLAPSLALGHAFGRVGCFLAGCCYGQPWAGGVSFPPGSVAHTEGQTGPLHPTQLYEAGGELAIFFLLLWYRPRQRFAGATALLYAAAYAALRLVVELFRGDAGRGLVAGSFSVAQLLSLALGMAAVLLLWRLGRRPAAS
jgi:phosphatidylglycerol:prolipoprotein diacylglycerol transferase